jgi:hypothetical protein
MAQNIKTQRKFKRKSSKKNVGKRRRTKVKRRVKKGGLGFSQSTRLSASLVAPPEQVRSN